MPRRGSPRGRRAESYRRRSRRSREAAALALAAESFHVVILDSRLESAQAAADTVTAGGRSAEAYGIDLLDVNTAVVALHDDVVARLGRADVVVHLVGGWRGSPGSASRRADN